MKIQQFQPRGVESLGRQKTGATGALASAKSGMATAETNVLNYLGKVGGEFIRREEKASFDDAVSKAHISGSDFELQDGVKEFYTADELKGRLPGFDLNDKSADKNGREINVPRKSIPAYQVYPQLLKQKLEGDMKNLAGSIINPIDRNAFIDSRKEYIADKVRAAGIKAAREQYVYLRNETDAKIKQANLTGKKALADQLASTFDGSEFEIKQRLKQNKEAQEVWQADELIRIEDEKGIRGFLKYLQKPDYAEKGPLPERKNIDLQNRLKSKLSSLRIRSGVNDGLYKAEINQRLDDAIFSMGKKGNPLSAEAQAQLMAQGESIKAYKKLVTLDRANEVQPYVNELYKRPEAQHMAVISELVNAEPDSTKAVKLADNLIKISEDIATRIATDANGLWQERNLGNAPQPGQKDFFARSVNEGKKASSQYKTIADPLTDAVAGLYAKKMQFATITEKKSQITEILQQVKEKADQDAIFKQIDRKNAGNLNVYADIIGRGEDKLIDEIDAGKTLRLDKTLDLIPKNMNAVINQKVASIFPIPTERQQYIEAIKDLYAKGAYDEGDNKKTYTDTSRLDKAVKSVIGNIVEYKGRNFLLPNNEMDIYEWERWIKYTDGSWIDLLGGIKGSTGEKVMEQIRDGEITLRESPKRGEWYLYNRFNQPLLGNNNALFLLKYAKNAPEREFRRSAREGAPR